MENGTDSTHQNDENKRLTASFAGEDMELCCQEHEEIVATSENKSSLPVL